jgi:hypothetical protein
VSLRWCLSVLSLFWYALTPKQISCWGAEQLQADLDHLKGLLAEGLSAHPLQEEAGTDRQVAKCERACARIATEFKKISSMGEGNWSLFAEGTGKAPESEAEATAQAAKLGDVDEDVAAAEAAASSPEVCFKNCPLLAAAVRQKQAETVPGTSATFHILVSKTSQRRYAVLCTMGIDSRFLRLFVNNQHVCCLLI